MNGIMMLIISAGLTVNFLSMMIIFPRKKGLAFTITMFVAFTAVLAALLYFTGLRVLFGSVSGLFYFPLLALLLRGVFPQKLFAFFMLQLLAMWQLRLGSAVAQIFTPRGSDEYYRLIFCIVMPCYIAYGVLIYLFGRKIFDKLFVNGRTAEWVLYSVGVMLSYLVMMMLPISPVPNIPLYLLLMFFILWGFFILCFAIINTHDKSKQRYEADFARSIVTSGREHYHKMDEMYGKFRILSHNYKYHLSTLGELLRSGNMDEMHKYLTDSETELSENELSVFCSNTVINALVASYAERCARLNIKCNINISMPDAVSVPNYEMCIIVGNLLENAVEACVKQSNGRRIELLIKPAGAQIVVKVKNNFNGVVLHEDGQPITSKKDGGLGLRSVQAVAAKYGGELVMEWDTESFTAYVLLRL